MVPKEKTPKKRIHFGLSQKHQANMVGGRR